jgi:hypothetical protein
MKRVRYHEKGDKTMKRVTGTMKKVIVVLRKVI